MNPQDASSFVAQIEDLFQLFTPSQREAVGKIFQRYSTDIVETVIHRYAETTSTFDRGTLNAMLIEEHNRRSPRKSDTPQWKAAKRAQNRERDEALDRLSETRRASLLSHARSKHPDAFRLLKKDPWETDIGRSLIWEELKEPR